MRNKSKEYSYGKSSEVRHSKRRYGVGQHIQLLKENPRAVWRVGQKLVQQADESVRRRQIETLMVPYEFARQALSDPVLMQEFLNDEFWPREGQHRPKEKDILQRSIEYHFGCVRKRGALYERCWTYARALEKFFNDNVDVAQLHDRIKAAHGLERLCRSSPLPVTEVIQGPAGEATIDKGKQEAEMYGDGNGGKEGERTRVGVTGGEPHHTPRTTIKAAENASSKKSGPSTTFRKFDMNSVLVVEEAHEAIQKLISRSSELGVLIQARIFSKNGDWVSLRYEGITFFPGDDTNSPGDEPDF